MNKVWTYPIPTQTLFNIMNRLFCSSSLKDLVDLTRIFIYLKRLERLMFSDTTVYLLIPLHLPVSSQSDHLLSATLLSVLFSHFPLHPSCFSDPSIHHPRFLVSSLLLHQRLPALTNLYVCRTLYTFTTVYHIMYTHTHKHTYLQYTHNHVHTYTLFLLQLLPLLLAA